MLYHIVKVDNKHTADFHVFETTGPAVSFMDELLNKGTTLNYNVTLKTVEWDAIGLDKFKAYVHLLKVVDLQLEDIYLPDDKRDKLEKDGINCLTILNHLMEGGE